MRQAVCQRQWTQISRLRVPIRMNESSSRASFESLSSTSSSSIVMSAKWIVRWHSDPRADSTTTLTLVFCWSCDVDSFFVLRAEIYANLWTHPMEPETASPILVSTAMSTTEFSSLSIDLRWSNIDPNLPCPKTLAPLTWNGIDLANDPDDLVNLLLRASSLEGVPDCARRVKSQDVLRGTMMRLIALWSGSGRQGSFARAFRYSWFTSTQICDNTRRKCCIVCAVYSLRSATVHWGNICRCAAVMQKRLWARMKDRKESMPP